MGDEAGTRLITVTNNPQLNAYCDELPFNICDKLHLIFNINLHLYH